MTPAGKRRLLRVVGAVAALGILMIPMCGDPALVTGAYVQAVTGERAVVAIVAPGVGELGLRVSRDGAVEHEIAARAGDANGRHEFAVDGLTAGVRYSYEVVDAAGARVDGGEFGTASAVDSDPVRFAVVGDSGGQPWWVWSQNAPLFRALQVHEWLPPASKPVAIGAALREMDPDFVIHVGDVVYPKGGQEHYRTGFFDPFAEVLRRSPCYPVLGNHDVMTEGGAPFLENFVLPTEQGGDDRNFTFRDGPLRVIGLDFNGEVTADDPAIVFLRRVLEAADEPWIIVVNHYPVLSVYRDKPRADLEEHYIPLCEEFGVDLLLAGHDHNYQRFGKPGTMIQVVTGGGGKSLYDIKLRPEHLEVAERAYHYCTVEITGPKLRLRAIDLTGKLLDDFTIDKSASAQLRNHRAPREARTRAL